MWSFDPSTIEAGNGVRIAYAGSRARVIAGTVVGVFGNILVVERMMRGQHQVVVVTADEIGNGAVSFRWTTVGGIQKQYPDDPLVVELAGDGSGGVTIGQVNNSISAHNTSPEAHDERFAGLQTAISNEATARNEQIVQAISQEANGRQTQIQQLNGQITETNRVLSGHLTQTLPNDIILSTSINGETPIPKARLASSIPLIGGGSWANDAQGTLAIYAGDDPGDATLAIFRTKTTSGGSVGVAQTVYFNDQIQLSPGTPVSIDTGIVLKDGADYQIVISAMSGITGSSASVGNGIMPQAIINGAAYGLAGNQNANALLNTIYKFRWQMHNMSSNPLNNVVGAFPLFGGTTISTVIYSSSPNFDVDGAGISTTYGTQTSTLFRVQTPVDDAPTLRLTTPAAPTGNMRFMVKIIEQQSAYPTN